MPISKSNVLRILGNITIGAIQLAILYTPAFFLTDLLLLKLEDGRIAIYIIPIFLGVCSFIVIFSSSKKEAVFKWLFSIPITIILWLWIVNMDFSIRALNWVIPFYGEPSGGGNAAGFFLLVTFSIVIFICILIGIFSSNIINSSKLKIVIFILQKVLCSIISIGIIVAIFVLNDIMPQYAPTYG